MTDSRLVTWDESACVRMHEAAVSILADPGVDIHHEGARAMLASAGARVDGVRVRFGAELVERALRPRRTASSSSPAAASSRCRSRTVASTSAPGATACTPTT